MAFLGYIMKTGLLQAGVKVESISNRSGYQKGKLFGFLAEVESVEIKSNTTGTPGSTKIRQFIRGNGAGAIEVLGSNGSLNVTLDDQDSNGSYGAVTVHDQNGDVEAGLDVNPSNGNGRVFADVGLISEVEGREFRVENTSGNTRVRNYVSPDGSGFIDGRGLNGNFKFSPGKRIQQP